MPAYYNEHDKFAAQWLRNLIAAGHIAPGVVDERSIEDVRPDELREFTQCHFFAGIGVWSYALRLAGWSDDRPVWTGSCPCQPFSSAGKGSGFDDERHLWPAFHHLIKECRPPSIFGEQVASKDAEPWIDLVHADLEALGYAFGCVPFPSAGVGAPHIRDRLYWMADSEELRRKGEYLRASRGLQTVGAADYSSAGRMADTIESERGRRPDDGALLIDGQATGRHEITSDAERDCELGGLADSERNGLHRATGHAAEPSGDGARNGLLIGSGSELRQADRPGPANGLWADADWLQCRDGKWRPVEPGTQPLVNGAPARVGRLRAYGNAISPQVAATFISAAMKAQP